MFKNKKVIYYLLALGVGMLLLLATNPEQLPIPLLLIPFLYMYVMVYLGVMLMSRKMFAIPRLPARMIAFSVSSVLIFLLVMRSLVNLSILDVVIATIILIFFIWYVRKMYIA